LVEVKGHPIGFRAFDTGLSAAPNFELRFFGFETFCVPEVFFRWKEATGLDLVLQPRALKVLDFSQSMLGLR